MKASTIILSALVAATSSVLAIPNTTPNTKRAEADFWDPMSELTPEQLRIGMELFDEYPGCADKCSGGAMDESDDALLHKLMPLCAHTDQDAENLPKEDYQNSYSCLCTDRIYLTGVWKCLVASCGGDKAAIKKAFDLQYLTCKLYGAITFPKPAQFLTELCVDKKDAPAQLKELEDVFEYSYAKSIPPLTATTYLAKWVATQTAVPKAEATKALVDTRTPVTCTNGLATGAGNAPSKTGSTAAPKATGNETDGGNGNGTEPEGAASGLRASGSLVMMAFSAGLVGALALAL